MQSYSINLVCPTRASITFCSFIIPKIGLELVGLWRPCCVLFQHAILSFRPSLAVEWQCHHLLNRHRAIPFRNVVLASYVEFLSGIPELDEIPKFGW